MTEASQAHHVDSQRLVRAAYLHKFLYFSEFPNQSSVNDSYSICIFNHDAIVAMFEPVKNRKINNKSLVILSEKWKGTQDLSSRCNVLYFPKTTPVATIKHQLSLYKYKPILTVGEHEKFITWGGIIQFQKIERKLTFSINVAQAKQVHISFRAKLLRIAQHFKE